MFLCFLHNFFFCFGITASDKLFGKTLRYKHLHTYLKVTVLSDLYLVLYLLCRLFSLQTVMNWTYFLFYYLKLFNYFSNNVLSSFVYIDEFHIPKYIRQTIPSFLNLGNCLYYKY